MGNEPSIHYRDDEKPRKTSRVLRSSSLRTQKPDFLTPKDQKTDESSLADGPPKKKGATGLRRSNTFTAITTFSRPLLIPKLVTSSTNDDKRTAKIFSLRRATKAKEMSKPDVSDVVDGSKEGVNEGVKDSCLDKDDLFIPRREHMDKHNSLSLSIPENDDENILVAEKNERRRACPSRRITLSVNKPDEENNANTITINQNKSTTVCINRKYDTKSLSSIDSGVREEEEVKDLSSQEEDIPSNRSSLFEEAFENTMERVSNTDISEGEEETRRHLTSAEKRRKNVLRSQSMNYQMNRPKLATALESKRSTSIDDGIANIGITKKEVNEPIGNMEKCLLGRRSSDSSLLKEQHVKRSEQFSVMLRQYRQQHEKKTKLSSYGLGVITENIDSEEKESQRFRLRRKSDYIDAWLKDQSERIDTLSAAAKGDPEKIRRLRASFRERPLQKPQKDLLPKRPNSVKLPRKNLNTFISSSDSEDPDDTGNKPLKLVDKNGNFISKKHSKNPLKKQLTDTLLLVDSSFKSANKMSPESCLRRNAPKTQSAPTNAIKFCSTPTSSVSANTSANNVAVVKPMQLTNNENSERTLQVNMVRRVDDFPVIKKPCGDSTFNDPVGERASDKELVKREENEKLELEEINFSKLPKDMPRSMSVGCTIVDSSLLNEKRKQISQSDPDSVDRISRSLHKVMGDLKTLRDQDVTLAKQLLGLEKSIKDFKYECLSEKSDDDQEY